MEHMIVVRVIFHISHDVAVVVDAVGGGGYGTGEIDRGAAGVAADGKDLGGGDRAIVGEKSMCLPTITRVTSHYVALIVDGIGSITVNGCTDPVLGDNSPLGSRVLANKVVTWIRTRKKLCQDAVLIVIDVEEVG